MNFTHLATLQDKDGNIIGYFPGDSEGAAEGPAITALANHLAEHPVDPTVPNVPSPVVILWKPVPPDEPTVRWPENRDNVAEGYKPPGA
jgi:hypothetical protein